MSTSFEPSTASLATLPQPSLHELLELWLDEGRAHDHARRLANSHPVDVAALIDTAASPEALADELARIEIVPVMTSHPSEMRPGAVLAALAESADATEAYAALRTAAHRVNIERPTIAEEVENLLAHFRRVIFDALCDMYEELETAARRRFGEQAPPIPTMFHFHSWVGCDRDGNPECTAAATIETAAAMHRCIVERYRQELAGIAESCERPLRDDVQTLIDRMTIAGDVCGIAADEFDMRLRDLQARVSGPAVMRAARIARMYASFGFHLATLEWRQHSDFILYTFDERNHALYPRQLRMHELDAHFRMKRIVESLGETCSLESYEAALTTPKACELMHSLRALAIIRERYGSAAVGEIIISNCEEASVVFAIERLARDAGVFELGELQIVPLFESLSALQNGPRIVKEVLGEPTFREKIARLESRFEIMVGYSDAAKDGGRIAADMLIRSAQRNLLSACAAFAVSPKFFHGRGGSFGRGTAPFWESLATVDPRIPAGEIKTTEQGEVVANRYGHAQLAARSLRAWFAITLQNVRERDQDGSAGNGERFGEIEACIAAECTRVFRELREAGDFMDFVRGLTQLDRIRGFPLSSRPASRSEDRHTKVDLAALRAVPFNIAFNLALAQVPAWYGTGSGLEKARIAFGLDALHEAYAQSSLFRASIERAASALALSNISLLHSRCTNRRERSFVQRLEDEYTRARTVISTLLQQELKPSELMTENSRFRELASYLHAQTDEDSYAGRLALAAMAASIGMTG